MLGRRGAFVKGRREASPSEPLSRQVNSLHCDPILTGVSGFSLSFFHPQVASYDACYLGRSYVIRLHYKDVHDRLTWCVLHNSRAHLQLT
jgi:hypothetical protein